MQYMQYGPKTSVPTQQQMMSGQASAEANGYSLVLVPNMQAMGQPGMAPAIPIQHSAWSQLPASALSALGAGKHHLSPSRCPPPPPPIITPNIL